MVKPCIGIKIISGVREVRVYYGKSMWRLYVPRFGGQKDLLEELMDLRQTRNLETYIQDFDVLCRYQYQIYVTKILLGITTREL